MSIKRIMKRVAAGFLAAIMTVSLAVPAMAEDITTTSDEDSYTVILAPGRNETVNFATIIANAAGGASSVKAVKVVGAKEITETTGKTIKDLVGDSKAISVEKSGDITATAYAYAWYDGNGTVYIYPGSKIENGKEKVVNENDKVTIYANSNCARLFYGGTKSGALENLESVDLSEINWSHTTTLEQAFFKTSSLKTIDLSNFNGTLSTAKSMSTMFHDSGVTKLILPDSWKFQSAGDTTGLKGNWKHNGKTYTAYAIENEQFGGGTYEISQDAPEDTKYDDIYEARGKYPNNVFSIYDRNNKFTGFCIDGYPDGVEEGTDYPGAGEISGYYRKESWDDAKDGNGYSETNKTEGGYFNVDTRVTGESELGSNMKETLIALLYYGPEVYGGDNKTIDTDDEYTNFQNCIWHFTNKYTGKDNGTWSDAALWKGKTFDSIKGVKTFNLDVYVSLRGVQNMITLKSIPEKTFEVEISKVDVANSNELPGATLTVKKGDTVVETWTSGSETHKITLTEGEYTLIEDAAPAGYNTASNIKFTVDSDGKVTVNGKDQNGKITMEDKAIPKTEFDVEISKVDAANKEELPGAKLKITKDTAAGEIVTDLNTNEKAEWTSTKETHKVKLSAGTYVLTETTAPKGYLKAESITFVVTSDGKVKIGDSEVTKVVMEDVEASEIGIKKVDDKKVGVEGAKLKITGKNAAGDDVTETNIAPWTTALKDGNTVIHVLKNMEEGTYTLEETEVPAGYVKADPITFKVDKNGNVTDCSAASDNIITMVDNRIIVKISKTDVGGNEIEGAELKIYEGTVTKDTKSEDKVIANDLSKDGEKDAFWTSEKDKTHEVQLAKGTYTLEETTAPDGYAKAESIVFTVDENGKVTVNGEDQNGKITMIDEETSARTVKISKVDVNGDEIEGATLEIYTGKNTTGTLVETWKSGSDKDENGKIKLHEVTLEPGTYTLHEDGEPDGYVKASDITFTVSKDGKVTIDKKDVDRVTMTDKWADSEVVFSKTDVAGEEIEGAKLTITGTTKDGKTIEEISWTSGSDGKDENNKIKTHSVVLQPGTYTLTEETAPDGYRKAESIKFTVEVGGKVTVDNQDQNGKITMVDGPEYTVKKVSSVKTSTFVEGAKLQLLDPDGKVVEEWTTDGKEHVILADLSSAVGKTYTIHEESAPDGYKVASDIKVKIENQGKTITMKDTPSITYEIVIRKVDENSEPLSGAKMQLLDSNGKVVEEWTTDGSSHIVTTELTKDAKYTVHEVSAPDGYKLASDQTFKYSGNHTIKVVDKKKKTTTKKEDETPSGSSEKKTTTTTTTTTSTTPSTPQTVTPSTEATETKQETTNTVTPRNRATGDASNMTLWISLAAAAIAGLGGFTVYKRRKTKNK